MSRRRIILLCPGIDEHPGDPNCWVIRGERRIENTTDFASDRAEYWADPIFRNLGAKARAAMFADFVNAYDGRPISLILHSNGNQVFCDALPNIHTTIDYAVMVAAACESSFTTNGLNAALLSDKVGAVNLWMGGQDRVLGFWARASRIPPWGWIPGFQFGTLGVDGMKDVDQRVAGRVRPFLRPTYGHSDFWRPGNFAQDFDEMVATAS